LTLFKTKEQKFHEKETEKEKLKEERKNLEKENSNLEIEEGDINRQIAEIETELTSFGAQDIVQAGISGDVGGLKFGFLGVAGGFTMSCADKFISFFTGSDEIKMKELNNKLKKLQTYLMKIQNKINTNNIKIDRIKNNITKNHRYDNLKRCD